MNISKDVVCNEELGSNLNSIEEEKETQNIENADNRNDFSEFLTP